LLRAGFVGVGGFGWERGWLGLGGLGKQVGFGYVVGELAEAFESTAVDWVDGAE